MCSRDERVTASWMHTVASTSPSDHAMVTNKSRTTTQLLEVVLLLVGGVLSAAQVLV